MHYLWDNSCHLQRHYNMSKVTREMIMNGMRALKRPQSFKCQIGYKNFCHNPIVQQSK